MSGIGGIFQWRESVDGDALVRLFEAMSHRGRDGGSLWQENSIGLVHQQLFNTPESFLEPMPLQSECSGLVIVADARLDNREMLCSRLGLAGQVARNIGDAGLILAAYEAWQTDCVHYLLGDFVFAIWDRGRLKLFLAMDPMGTRSLFFHTGANRFSFASDIVPLLKAGTAKKSLDEEAFVMQAVGFKRLTPGRTSFAGINSLRAGHLIVARPAGMGGGIEVDQTQYYRLRPMEHEFMHPGDCIESFREILNDAVKARMRTAFPIATFLSGGLDSSAIAGFAAINCPGTEKPLFAVSSCLPEGTTGVDEREHVMQVAAYTGLPVAYVAAEKGPCYYLQSTPAMYGAPTASNANLYSELFRVINARGARTVLDGLAGEWGPSYPGSGHYHALFRSGKWLPLLRDITMQAGHGSAGVPRLLWREVLRPLLPENPLLRNWQQKNSLADLPAFLPHVLKRYRISDLYGSRSDRRTALRSTEQNIYEWVDTGRSPKQHHAAHFDLEIRTPYLDERVIRFCMGLGSDWFIRNGWKRYFIRCVTDGVMPDSIRWRRDKKPFLPNYYQLMQADSVHFRACLKTLNESQLVREYIDLDRIRHTINQFDARGSWLPVGNVDYARRIVDRGMQAAAFLAWFET